MVNETVNEIVQFSSSSEVTASIASCYYYDKFGNQVNVSPGGDIKVSASPGVMGTIKVEAPVPTNNTPRYVYVRVSNGESEDRYFTVVQYPLEYITNVQGYYSYRDDFGGTTYESAGKNMYVAVGGWIQNTRSWSRYSSSVGTDSKKYMFSSKFAKPKADGTSQILYYYWSKNGKLNENASNLSSLDNGRMYRVKLASSSADYSVGIPRLDENGWTDDSQENKLLVSPSFMIASQLGATLAPTSVQQAASHCSQYVETYKDESGRVIHLNDWRLPTEAEINIIIRFQYRENAAMDEVLSGHWYWSATGQVENPGAKDQSSSTSAVRCVRSDF